MGNVWALRDSNPGPTDYESAALTTELRAHEWAWKIIRARRYTKRVDGLWSIITLKTSL